MEEQEKVAWTEECEAVLVAITSQLDELPTYEHRMNVLVNSLRGVITRESVRGVREVTGKRNVELPHVMLGVQMLVEEFLEQFATVPKRMKDVIQAEDGCGHCDICMQAKRDAYEDGKAIIRPRQTETVRAVESLIAAMLGGSRPKN